MNVESFFIARTNSCVDTLALLMPNNYSKTGFGYKHRPGSFIDYLFFDLYTDISIGHACAGTAGYCDVFGKCRAVDAEGPLSRLKNMLLSEENIRTLTQIGQVCVVVKFNIKTKMFVFFSGILVGFGVRSIRSYWFNEYFCQNLFSSYTFIKSTFETCPVIFIKTSSKFSLNQNDQSEFVFF